MGKDSPSPSPAPDYTGAARAQGGANVQAAIANQLMGQQNQYTPLGSRTFSRTGTETIPGAEGNAPVEVPRYESTINLSPTGQRLFDTQQQIQLGLGEVGQQGIGQVREALGRPFNFQGPALTSSIGGAEGIRGEPAPTTTPGINLGTQDRSRVEDALYGRATSRLDPQWAQSKQAMDAQLANQGIPIGSEAYRQAMGNYDRARNDAYANARNDAIMAGGAEESRQFGQQLAGEQARLGSEQQAYGQRAQSTEMANRAQQYRQQREAEQAQFGNQARQQALQEQAYLRGLPLNQVIGLMGGSQVQMPQFANMPQGGIQPAPLFGAAQNQAAYGQGAYNQQVGSQNAALGGMYGLGGSIAGALPWTKFFGF